MLTRIESVEGHNPSGVKISCLRKNQRLLTSHSDRITYNNGLSQLTKRYLNLLSIKRIMSLYHSRNKRKQVFEHPVHLAQRRLTDLHRWYHLILSHLGIFNTDTISPCSHHASHPVARPTCIVCHKSRSRNYRINHSLICSRPRCAKIIQTAADPSRVETHIYVHHYHHLVHSDLDPTKTSQLPLLPDRPELLGDTKYQLPREGQLAPEV